MEQTEIAILQALTRGLLDRRQGEIIVGSFFRDVYRCTLQIWISQG